MDVQTAHKGLGVVIWIRVRGGGRADGQRTFVSPKDYTFSITGVKKDDVSLEDMERTWDRYEDIYNKDDPLLEGARTNSKTRDYAPL